MIDTVVEIPISGQLPGHGGADGNQSYRGSSGDCFLVGPENRLVTEAVNSVLNREFLIYNPLVFAGPSGTGKTHLATGLVAAWRRQYGHRGAGYVPAIDFARQWTDAVEAQATDEFHSRYRRLDLLAIDDVDVLAEKPAAQEELLHTIDALTASGSRVLLTSRSPPGAVAGMVPALEARLVGGLVIRLALPSRAVRLAAARKFAGLRGVDLPDETAMVLADGLPEPLSAIWAATVHLEVSAQLEPGKTMHQRVREYLAQRNTAEPSLRDIAVATARHFSLRLAELRSSSRRRAVVTARDVAMYLARTLTGKSFEQIGAYFNGRDHSTVSYGCSKTADLVKSDPSLRSAVDQLRRQVRATKGGPAKASDPCPPGLKCVEQNS